MTRADENSFEFAVKRTAGWVLKATTIVKWGKGQPEQLPTVSSVECRAEGRQFDFTMNSSGEINWLHARFLGDADDDGEREQVTLLGDRLWLYIDGERWEYANISVHSTKFSNLRYPPSESDIVLPVWRGYQAVRKADDQPWINLKLIYYRLINAKRLEWSFKSRDWTVVDKTIAENQLPKGWRDTRYIIDNEGLLTAFSWCARHVASGDAYVLPKRMREISLGKDGR